MKIILCQEVTNLGQKDDIVNVKSGYARNYLIPRKMALLFTPSNLKILEHEKEIENTKANKEKRQASKLKEKMEKVSLTFPVTAGEDGKIFGTVTEKDIEELLLKEKFKTDRHKITLPEHIKETGVYMVKIALHPEVDAEVKLWVVSKD